MNNLERPNKEIMPNSKLSIELREIIKNKFSDAENAREYLERLKEGKLTKHENQQSHFCAYFAAIDPVAKEIFAGSHKKAGLWLVNGGHIDEGETLKETLKREIDEEWGLRYEDLDVSEPELLTITEIYNPEKQPCLEHFDVWHFVVVDKNSFNPDKGKMSKEFHENRWLGMEDARKLFIDKNHNEAVDFLEDNLFEK